MTQPHHLHEEENEELVSRYFDEGTTPQETAALAALLARDPAAARSFAETARLHGRLEAASPRARLRPRGFLNLTRLTAAAAAVIAAAAGAVWYLKAGSGGTGATVRVTDLVENSILPPPPSLARVRRVVRTAPGVQVSAAQTPAEWDALADRWLTNVDPEGKTVRRALAELSEEMRANNLLGRPGFDGLAHTVGGSKIAGEEEPLIRYPYPPPYSVREFLGICGLYQDVTGTPGTGMKVIAEVFDSPDASGEPRTSRFPVPTDFYAGTRPAPDRPEAPDAAYWLRRAGLPLGDTESARYSPSTSTLQLTASREKRRRLAETLEVARTRAGQWQYFVNIHCEVFPKDKLPAGFDIESGMVLNKEELASQRAAGSGDDIQEIAIPSVIMRANQQGTVEKTRAWGTGASDWTGYRQVFVCGPAGELTRVTGQLDIGLRPGGSSAEEELGSVITGSIKPGGVAMHYLTDFELWLPDGHTGVFAADVPEHPEVTILAYVTVTLIESQGQARQESGVGGNAIGESTPAAPDQDPLPVGIPVEGNPGFVLSPYARDRGMVDVQGMRSGTKVVCPYTGRRFRTP